MEIFPAQALLGRRQESAWKAQSLRPYCGLDCNLAASGMLYQGRVQEREEEMEGPFAKRSAGKGRRLNLLVPELE